MWGWGANRMERCESEWGVRVLVGTKVRVLVGTKGGGVGWDGVSPLN